MAINPCMAESRPTRLVTILMLYMAQGVPLGLFDFAIPAWMAANGATGAEIGYMAGMAGIPWSLKFFNGALMDRYTYLPMGRRRAWLIGAQLLMVAALLGCALIGVGPRDYLVLGAFALVVNSAVVFQDVAADALAVDMSDDRDQGIVGGMMAGGQSLGIAISAAVAGTVIYYFGISAAYAGTAVTMLVVATYLSWVIERRGEKRLPWSTGAPHPASVQLQVEHWPTLIKDAFRNIVNRESLKWIVAIFLSGSSYGFMTVAMPLVAANYAGWNEAQLGSANGLAQIIAGVTAITIGGYLAAKLGLKGFTIFATVAFAMLVASFAAFDHLWSMPIMIWAMVLSWIVIYFIMMGAKSAINLKFCDPKTAATQFAIYMACSNMGLMFAGFSFGFVESFGGVQAVFIFLAGLLGLAALIVGLVRIPERASDPILAEQASTRA